MNEVKAHQGKIRNLSRKEARIAALFFTAAIAMRVPFRSRMTFLRDSAKFSLAVRWYDVTPPRTALFLVARLTGSEMLKILTLQQP